MTDLTDPTRNPATGAFVTPTNTNPELASDLSNADQTTNPQLLQLTPELVFELLEGGVEEFVYYEIEVPSRIKVFSVNDLWVAGILDPQFQGLLQGAEQVRVRSTPDSLYGCWSMEFLNAEGRRISKVTLERHWESNLMVSHADANEIWVQRDHFNNRSFYAQEIGGSSSDDWDSVTFFFSSGERESVREVGTPPTTGLWLDWDDGMGHGLNGLWDLDPYQEVQYFCYTGPGKVERFQPERKRDFLEL